MGGQKEHIIILKTRLLIIPRHEGTHYLNTWQESTIYYKKQQKHTTHYWYLGYDQNQHHTRSISDLQPGTILGLQTHMDKHLPLRILWGPEFSNQISSSKKRKNVPLERPREVHITDEDLYKKIQCPTIPTETVIILYEPTPITDNNITLGNRQPDHVSQKGSQFQIPEAPYARHTLLFKNQNSLTTPTPSRSTNQKKWLKQHN